MNCSNLVSIFQRATQRVVIYSMVGAALTLSACMKPSGRGPDRNANFDDTKGGANQPAATFYNDEVVGSAVVSQSFSGFSIPTEKLFNFKTCVRDKRTQESVKGHKFSVRGAEGGDQSVRSDESGCINWSEKIAYNAISDAKFIALKRTIIADGMHTGARDLSIAINPWSRDSDLVRDLTRRPVPDEQLAPKEESARFLKGELKSGEVVKRYLWIDDLRSNANHNPGGDDGANVDFTISANPKFLARNVRGETDPVQLADGKFLGEFWVVAKTDVKSQACMVIAKSGPIDGIEMVGGRMRDEIKMKIRYANTYGQLELVGSLAPRQGPASLMPFEGVWMMGDHTQLLGMKFAELRKPTYANASGDSYGPGLFSAKQYISTCLDVSNGKSDAKSLEKVAELARQAQIPGVIKGAAAGVSSGSTNSIPAGTILSPNNKTTPDLLVNDCVEPEDVKRLFPEDDVAKSFVPGPDLLSCMNRHLPSGIAKIQQFEFSHVDVRPEPIVDPLHSETTTERTIKYRVSTRVTNPLAQGAPLRDLEFTLEKSDGSVDVVRTTHDGMLIFTDKIHHMYFHPERYMLKIIRIRHASGFTARLAIVFNPWDNNGFTFARDLRGVTKQTVAQVNLMARPKSELLLTSFNWGTQGFRYEVDDFLTLKMFKQFNLQISPRVLRYSSLTDGRMKNEPLRDGIYLMKLAIQKDYKYFDDESREYVTAVRKLVRVTSGMINTPVEVSFRDFRILKIRSNMMIELATINESKLTQEQRSSLQADVSLDSLIEKGSGLQARTFIGPVVAYSNGFTASMRPADDLAESYCKTIDCDELKKNDKIPPSELSDDAKYFGSLRGLANKSASDMIERQIILEKAYQRSMAGKVQLSKFLKDANLELVALNPESPSLKAEVDLQAANQTLPVATGYALFVQKLSNQKPADHMFNNMYMNLVPQLAPQPALNVQAFQSNLFSRKALSADTSVRLCTFFVEDLIARRNAAQEAQLGFNDRTKVNLARRTLVDNCVKDVFQQTGAPVEDREPVFAVERKVRALKVTDAERLGGNLMYINVGANSSYDRGTSSTFSYGFSPVGALSGALKLLPGTALAQSFLDASGLSLSWSASESAGTGEGSSVGTGQNLAIELRGMRLTIGEWERCATIRLSRSFVESNFSNLSRVLPDNLDAPAKLARMGRGLFVCEGETRKTPVKIDERYYQFSQAMGDEVMNDPAALENHPYLMGLRGRSDYARFVRLIEARPKTVRDLPKHISIGELPIDRLQKVFRTSTPTFPGLITLEDDSVVPAKTK